MYKLNRTDVLLMNILYNGQSVNPADGITIDEIMVHIRDDPNSKSRMTVYRRLKGLVAAEYIAKGILADKADTFYLLDKGKTFISK